MNLDMTITSNDIIYYIVLFIAAFIGGFIGAKMGCLSTCISQQRKISTRDDIERRMDEELEKSERELPYLKNKVEHRDPRLDD